MRIILFRPDVRFDDLLSSPYQSDGISEMNVFGADSA